MYNKHLRPSTPSLHSSKVHCCHKAQLRRLAQTTTSIWWTHSGSNQIFNMSSIKSTPSLLSLPGRGISSWSNFFPIQFYIGTRCLLTDVSKPNLPISALQSTEWPSSRRNKNGQRIILRANRAGNRLIKTCTKRRCIQNFLILSPIGDIRYPSGAILE
jgi:hypothetical protein